MSVSFYSGFENDLFDWDGYSADPTSVISASGAHGANARYIGGKGCLVDTDDGHVAFCYKNGIFTPSAESEHYIGIWLNQQAVPAVSTTATSRIVQGTSGNSIMLLDFSSANNMRFWWRDDAGINSTGNIVVPTGWFLAVMAFKRRSVGSADGWYKAWTYQPNTWTLQLDVSSKDNDGVLGEAMNLQCGVYANARNNFLLYMDEVRVGQGQYEVAGVMPTHAGLLHGGNMMARGMLSGGRM